MKKIIICLLIAVFFIPNASAFAATKSLNTKGNKDSCKVIKTKYQSSVMSNWANGLASDEDVLKEIDLNIKMLNAAKKSTTGKINKTINNWIKTEKNTKDSLINKNINDITASMNSKINLITEFQKLCKFSV